MKIKKITIFLAFIFVYVLCFGVTATATSSVEITVGVGLNSEKGEITLSYIDEANSTISNTYTAESTSRTLQIPSGTTVSVSFTVSEGYHFGLWNFTTSNSSSILRDNTKNIVARNFNYIFNNTATITPHFISNSGHYVAYETVAGRFIGIEEVMTGGNAKGVEAPKVKGSNFSGWSDEINNIVYDLVVNPNYESSVFRTFIDFFPMFASGLGKTLLFSIISVFLALFLGLIVCLLRISKFKPISFIAAAYIEIIRGVPLLLQLLLIYTIMPNFKIGFISVEIFSCVLAMFINSSAYVAEIFRSGIQAVDAGQMEAARSLGMSKTQTMIKVILPQAIRNILPSIGNELIMVIKETSLASSVDMSIGELMSVKNQITAASYINIEAFIVVAIIYFCVTFALSKAVRYVERRLADRE